MSERSHPGSPLPRSPNVGRRTDGGTDGGDILSMILHEFLTTNRQLLIGRCRDKVAKRFGLSETAATSDHGVPLFLQQLVETLREEQTTHMRGVDSEPTPAPTEIGRAAALHGAELLRRGFRVDQVVHDYGGVCQCVTALAVEQEVSISTDEFRTLNRCLDNAIADAVTSFGAAHQTSIDRQTETSQQRLVVYSAEQRRLIDIARQALAAIKTGTIGVSGPTGLLLAHALDELSSLAERTLHETPLASSTKAST
jgi:hypothetical protein